MLSLMNLVAHKLLELIYPSFHWGITRGIAQGRGGVLRYSSDGDVRMRRNFQTQKKSFRLDPDPKKKSNGPECNPKKVQLKKI